MIFSELWNDGIFGRLILLLFGVLILAIPLMIVGAVYEERAWESFKEAHACRIVGKISGSSGTGISTTISPNGQVGMGPTTVYIPGKTGWQCNDGVTYWR